MIEEMISLEKTKGRLNLRLEARRLGSDLSVAITGGGIHVGAVGVGTVQGNLASSSVITVPGHRDDRIAKEAAERLSKDLGCNCVVVAGVHYEEITVDEIKDIMVMSNTLIDELEEKL